MTRLFSEDETIQPKLDPRGYPASFIWQGRIQNVDRVIQHWQVDTEWWSEMGQVNREYFAVTTREGILCVLYRDYLDEQWHLERVYD